MRRKDEWIRSKIVLKPFNLTFNAFGDTCVTVDVIEVVRRQEFSPHLQIITLKGLGVRCYFMGDVHATACTLTEVGS